MSGIDVDKLKDKLAEYRGEGGGSSTDVFWKPEKNSKHRIRILLPPDGTGVPFKEYSIHYEFRNSLDGAPSFLCPDRNGLGYDCPACDLGSKMYDKGKEEDSSEHIELAKDLWPSDRYYSAIVERGEDRKSIEEGPAWYGYSGTVYERLISMAVDPDYGDITDPESGRDMKLEYTQREKDRFPSTSIDPAPNTSVLAPSEEEREEIIQSIPDITEGLVTLDASEIEDFLDEYIEQEYGEQESETEKYTDEEEETDKVEEAFQELEGMG